MRQNKFLFLLSRNYQTQIRHNSNAIAEKLVALDSLHFFHHQDLSFF